jgi:hypothetical protein
VAQHDIKTYAVVNKVRSDRDIEFIKNNISSDLIIDFIYESYDLRDFEQGDLKGLDRFVVNNKNVLKNIENKLNSIPKDWQRYYNVQKQIYINDAEDWYSQFFGEDLTKYIDNDFSYEEILSND